MKARKGLALKPNKLVGKKPTTTKIFQDRTGTPATKGLPLLQQISSAGLKQSSKKKQAIHVKTSDKQRVKVEQDHCQKETMIPFNDKGMVNGVILLHVNRKTLHGANTTQYVGLNSSNLHCTYYVLTSTSMKRNDIVNLSRS